MGGKGEGKGESSKSFGKGLFKRGLLGGSRKSSDGRSTGSTDNVSLPESPLPQFSQQRQQLEEELQASKQTIVQLQRSYQAMESEHHVLRVQLGSAEQTTESLREQLLEMKLQMQSLQSSKGADVERAVQKLQRELESSKLKTTDLLHQVQKLTETNDQMHEELNEARMQQRKLRMELLKHEAKGKAGPSTADAEAQQQHITELQSHIRDLETHNQELLKQLEEHATAAISMMQGVQHVQALQEEVSRLKEENEKLLKQAEEAHASFSKDRGTAVEEVEALRQQLQAKAGTEKQLKEANEKLRAAEQKLGEQEQAMQTLVGDVRKVEQLRREKMQVEEAARKLEERNRKLEETNRKLHEEGQARDLDMVHQKTVVEQVKKELEQQAVELERQAKKLEQQQTQLEEQDRLLADADDGVMAAEKERAQAAMEVEELQGMVQQLQGRNLSLVNELQMQAAQHEREKAEAQEAGLLRRKLADIEREKADMVREKETADMENGELKKVIDLEAQKEALVKETTELKGNSVVSEVERKRLGERLQKVEGERAELLQEQDRLQHENEHLIEQVQKLQGSCEELKKQQENLTVDTQLTGKVEELEKRNYLLERENAEVKELCASVEREADEANQKLQELTSQNAKLQQTQAQLEEQVQEAAQKVQQLTFERDDLQHELQQAQQNGSEAEQKLQQLSSEHGNLHHEHNQEKMKAEEALGKLQQLAAQHEKLRHERDQAELEAEEAVRKLQQATSERDELQHENERMKHEAEEAVQKLQLLTMEHDNLLHEHEQAKREAEEGAQKLQQLASEHDAILLNHERAALEARKAQEKVQQLRAEVEELQKGLMAVQQQRELLVDERHLEVLQHAEKLQQRVEELEAANVQLLEAKQQLEGANMQLEVDKEQLQLRTEQLEQQNETLDANVSRLQEQYTVLHEQFNEWDHKTKLLEERNSELQAAAAAAQALQVRCADLESQLGVLQAVQEAKQQLQARCVELEKQLQRALSSETLLQGADAPAKGESEVEATSRQLVAREEDAQMGEREGLGESGIEVAELQVRVHQLQVQNQDLVQQLAVQAHALEEEQKASAEAVQLQQVVVDLEAQILQLQEHSAQLLAEREVATATLQENKQRSMEVEQLNQLVHELEVQNLNLLEEVHRSGRTSPQPELVQGEVEKLREALSKVHQESEKKVAEAKAEVAWLRQQLNELTGKRESGEGERGVREVTQGESSAAYVEVPTRERLWLSARESRESMSLTGSEASEGPGQRESGSMTATERGALSARERGLLSAILRGEVVASPSQVLLSPTRWTPQSGEMGDIELRVDELMQLVMKLEQENNALSDAARRASSDEQPDSSQELQDRISELEEANRQLQERCLAAEQQEVERVQNAISAHFLADFDHTEDDPHTYELTSSAPMIEEHSLRKRDGTPPVSSRGRRSRSQSTERKERSITPNRSRSVDNEMADSLLQELEELRYKYREENKSAEALRAQNARTWFELNQAVDQVKDLKEKKAKVEADLTRCESEVVYLREQIKESELQLEELLSALSSYEHSNVLVTKRHEALQNRVRRQLQELQRTSHSYVEENEQLRQECMEWRKRAEDLQTAYDSLNEEADMMQQRLEELVKEVDKPGNRSARSGGEREEEEADSLRQQVEAMEEHLYNVGLRNEALQNSLNALEEKLLMSQAECRALQDENSQLRASTSPADGIGAVQATPSSAKSHSTHGSSPKTTHPPLDPSVPHPGMTSTLQPAASSPASSVDSLDQALKRSIDMWDTVLPAARSSPSARQGQAVRGDQNVTTSSGHQGQAVGGEQNATTSLGHQGQAAGGEQNVTTSLGLASGVDEALIEDVAVLRRKNEELNRQLLELEVRAKQAAAVAAAAHEGGVAGSTVLAPEESPRPASPLLSPFMQHAMDALRDENEDLSNRVLSLESELRHRDEHEYRGAGGYAEARVLAPDEQSRSTLQEQGTVRSSYSQGMLIQPSAWVSSNGVDSSGVGGTSSGQGSGSGAWGAVQGGQGVPMSEAGRQMDVEQYTGQGGQGVAVSEREERMDAAELAALLAHQEQSPQGQQHPEIPVTSAQLFKAQSQELQARLNALYGELIQMQVLCQQEGESASLQQRLQDILHLLQAPSPPLSPSQLAASTAMHQRQGQLSQQDTVATNFFSTSSAALSESSPRVSARLYDSATAHRIAATQPRAVQVLSPGREPNQPSSSPRRTPLPSAFQPVATSATAVPAQRDVSMQSTPEPVYEPIPWQPAQVVDVTDLSDLDNPASLATAGSVMSPGRLTQFLHLVSELEDILGIVHVTQLGESRDETAGPDSSTTVPSDQRMVHRLQLVADRARERMGPLHPATSNNPFTMLTQSSQQHDESSQQHDESMTEFDPFNQQDTTTSAPSTAIPPVPAVKLDSHQLSPGNSPPTSQRYVKRRLNTPERTPGPHSSTDPYLRTASSDTSEQSTTMLDASTAPTSTAQQAQHAPADVLNLEQVPAVPSSSADYSPERGIESMQESERQLSSRRGELQQRVQHLQEENRQLQGQCEALIHQLKDSEDHAGRWVILKRDHEQRVGALKDELRSVREKMEGLQGQQMAHTAERQQRVAQLRMLEHQLSLEESERSQLRDLVSQLQALGAALDPDSPAGEASAEGSQVARASHSSGESSPHESFTGSPTGLEQMVAVLSQRNAALERKVKELRAAAQQLRDQVKQLEGQNQRSESSLRKLLTDKNKVEQEMTAVLESIELLREEMKAIIDNLKLKETQQLELCEALEAKEQEAIQLRGQVRDLSRALAAATRTVADPELTTSSPTTARVPSAPVSPTAT